MGDHIQVWQCRQKPSLIKFQLASTFPGKTAGELAERVVFTEVQYSRMDVARFADSFGVA